MYGGQARGIQIYGGGPEGKKPLGILRITRKGEFRKWDMRARIELIWLCIGTGGELL
jgi:hypothetical protein